MTTTLDRCLKQLDRSNAVQLPASIEYAELYQKRCKEVARNPYEREWIRCQLSGLSEAIDKAKIKRIKSWMNQTV